MLWGYSVQTERRFEIIVADDGSTDETRATIERIRNVTGMEIRHVWHEDQGFRKTRICNRAFVVAQYDYILCADGDCIPRYDLVETHKRYAKQGRFLCGTAIRLSDEVSDLIDRDSIISGDAFQLSWLKSHGMPLNRYLIRMAYPRWFQPFANRYLCNKPRFNGGNSSAWKADLFRVNGYDEDLTYGGEDWELGFRLQHSGLEAFKIRCSAHCLHLHHDRPYVTDAMREATQLAKRRTLESHRQYVFNGIVKQANISQINSFEYPGSEEPIQYEPNSIAIR